MGLLRHAFLLLCMGCFFVTVFVLLQVEVARSLHSDLNCEPRRTPMLKLFASKGYVNVTGMNESVRLFYNPPNLCSSNNDGGEVTVFLVIICSAPGNLKRRKAIRESWLSQNDTVAEGYRVMHIFHLGHTNDTRVQLWLEEEIREFGDIAMYNVRDAYQYLTLKTLVGFAWAENYCTHFDYVIKVDDDAFLHLSNLHTALSMIELQTAKQFVFGYVCRRFAPPRNKASKWYLPPEQFPGDVMPTFTAGWCYVMSRATMITLLRASESLPLIRLEDVYVTGLCREHSEVPVLGHPGFSATVDVLDPLFPENLIATHGVDPEDHIAIWQKCKSLMIRSNETS